jgi:hypothetical protein
VRLVGLQLPPQPKATSVFYTTSLAKNLAWDMWLRAKVKAVPRANRMPRFPLAPCPNDRSPTSAGRGDDELPAHHDFFGKIGRWERAVVRASR